MSFLQKFDTKWHNNGVKTSTSSYIQRVSALRDPLGLLWDSLIGLLDSLNSCSQKVRSLRVKQWVKRDTVLTLSVHSVPPNFLTELSWQWFIEHILSSCRSSELPKVTSFKFRGLEYHRIWFGASQSKSSTRHPPEGHWMSPKGLTRPLACWDSVAQSWTKSWASVFSVSSKCPPPKPPLLPNSLSTNKPNPQKTRPQIPLPTICESISCRLHNRPNRRRKHS